MLDTTLRPRIDPVLNQFADQLGKIGIGPNQITIYGFVVDMIGCFAIGLQNYHFGLALILINRLADGLDGAVARYNQEKGDKQSPFGAYLDIILDMILFGAFVFLFVLGQPHHSTGAAFALFSFIGLFATSLGGYLVGLPEEKTKRVFYHPTRLIEGTEMIAFMVLACLFVDAFSAIAIVFGVFCWITTTSRIWFAYRDLKKA